MQNNIEAIPFHLEMNRVIELLAKQIYQSPLALLRENCQNAFDAILLRRFVDNGFEPRIDIRVTPTKIEVEDNGIGMTVDEIKKHFWRAGSSGKNNDEARAAGVVGTFGIGAMANFGVATDLTVETESYKTNERIISRARRDTLSATENCIEIESIASNSTPGTKITSTIQQGTRVNVGESKNYISQFVRYIDIPVYFNGELISVSDYSALYSSPQGAFTEMHSQAKLGDATIADVELYLTQTGDLSIRLNGISFLGKSINGCIILNQNSHQIFGLRSKFLLAAAGVASSYNFGGIADLDILGPTAGREALTTDSIQVLQKIVTEAENFVSARICFSAFVNQNTNFMSWAIKRSRHDLLGKLQIHLEPRNQKATLYSLYESRETKKFNLYDGADQGIINQFATDESPLIILSSRQPRKNCEIGFISKFCPNVLKISDSPKVLKVKNKSEMSFEEAGIAFRICGILATDYFVNCQVEFGEISHGLPILIDSEVKPFKIYLDSKYGSISTILQVYKTDYQVVTGLIKDFIRNAIFPKITNLVPSSTKQGAEAFLKSIKKPKEYFEYETTDLKSLSSIWEDYLAGKITLTEASNKSIQYTSRSVQLIERNAAVNAKSLIQDVLDNETILKENSSDSDEDTTPLPAILRSEIDSNAKLLIIEDDAEPLKGYRHFVALTDAIRNERTDFFMQPHSTEIVWGGQKVLFIFQHHSKQFGLYYELQGNENISDTAGGRSFKTCTIILKNQIYIPIPQEISQKFIPDTGKSKRFEVRSDFLFNEEEDNLPNNPVPPLSRLP